MATTNITPNAGGAPSGDAGGTPNATPSNAVAQPQHSGDRALANFTGTDPNKGGVAAPAAAATPGAAAAATEPAAAITPDLASVLDAYIEAPDPVAAATEPPAAAAAVVADPLEALKDNPRVMELVAAETSLKGLLTKSEYVKEVAHIGEAIADAEVLWQIMDGKADVGSILDAAKSQSPQAFPKILDSLRAYLLKETGVPVAAAAAGVPDPATMTPEQRDIYELKKKLSDRETADKQAEDNRKLNERKAQITTTKTAIVTKITELLKDTVFEGEADRFFAMTGPIIGQDKVNQLIEAAGKGDFKLIEMAIKKAQSAESVRLKTIIGRLVEMQKKKGATIPKQGTGGAPGAGNEPVVKPASNKEERLKNMASALKTA